MPTKSTTEVAPTLLVVIDHHEAKVYSTLERDAVGRKIVPYDPHGYGKHLHSAHEWTDGKRVPERKSYYEAIAKTLSGAGRIVIFGSGTGRSCAMDQLMEDLTEHHPTVAAKVVGTVSIDAHHMTEYQMLAEAQAVCARCHSSE